MWALPLLAYGAVVGLRIDDVTDVPLERAIQIAEELGHAIEHDSELRAVVDDPSWSRCTEPGRCLAELRARTGAGPLVLLRIYGGLTQIRVFAERPEAEQKTKAEVDLPLDAAGASAATDALVHRLFPELLHRAQAPLVLAPPGPPAPPPPRLLPWVVAGTSVLALAVGVGLGLSSRGARTAVETTPLSDPEIARLTDQTQTQGLAANLLFGAAGVGALVAGALFLDVL